jgi:hypothetical protein
MIVLDAVVVDETDDHQHRIRGDRRRTGIKIANRGFRMIHSSANGRTIGGHWIGFTCPSATEDMAPANPPTQGSTPPRRRIQSTTTPSSFTSHPFRFTRFQRVLFSPPTDVLPRFRLGLGFSQNRLNFIVCMSGSKSWFQPRLY